MHKYPGIRQKGHSWYYRVQYEHRRREIGPYDSADEAYTARIQYLKNIKSQDLVDHNMTVAQFCERYIEEYLKVNVRRLTKIKDTGVLKNHIVPLLGHYRLRDLKPYHIAQFQNAQIKNKSPAVAHNTMKTLRKVLNKAVEWEFLERSPFRGKLPPSPVNEHPVLTLRELFNLVENLDGKDKCVVALAGFSGLRRGEIFGLRWEDIDYKANTINLRRQHVNGEIVQMKTKGSRSLIPIWPRLPRILAEWCLRSRSPEWVFMGRGGKPTWGESWCSDEWRQIKKRFGLPKDLRFHDLRHTYASILLSEGAQPGDVQKFLRHTSIRTTMDIYRHLLPGQLEKNFEIFNELSGEKSGPSEKINL